MSESLIWYVDRYEELDIKKLYEIVFLRADVFVVEQNCPYLDVDYKDQKAIHIQGYVGGRLAAYCRLFSPGDYFDEASIGRVLVSRQCRGFDYGHQLMDKAIQLMDELLGETKITISAQLYLKRFYESHGFVKVGDEYLEDDIPHIRMKRNQL